MANVLSELFQDIADSIRSKTGGTDKIAPADFPASIEAIEGGGGGSMATGVYWKHMASPKKPQNKGVYFSFNGKTYFVSRVASSTSSADTQKREVYLVENGTYTLVTEGVAFSSDPDMYRMAIVEYNGKIHMLGGGDSTTVHKMWDGESFINAAYMPYGVNSKCAAVWNGELYIFSFYGGCYLFKWVEATDTYETICQITTNAPNKYSTGNLFVKDGNLYLAAQKNLYIYENGNFTLLRTADITIGDRICRVDGDYIWAVSSSDRLYKYHIDTNNYIDCGSLPSGTYYYWYLDIVDGRLRLHVEWSSNVCGANMEMYEVE